MENTSRDTKSKLCSLSFTVFHNWFPQSSQEQLSCLPSLLKFNTNFPSAFSHIKHCAVFQTYRGSHICAFPLPTRQNIVPIVWIVVFYLVDLYTSFKTQFTCASLSSTFLRKNSPGLCAPALCCMAFNTRYHGYLNQYPLPPPELMNPTGLYLNFFVSVGHRWAWRKG